MIENLEQLDLAHKALASDYLGLAALRRDLLPVNPQGYASSAETALSGIRKHRAEIEGYLGLTGAEPLHEPVPFLIENDDQLRGTHEAMGHLYRALAALRKQLPPTARNYALYAEGTIDEILKLQAEIDTYLGLNEMAPASPAEAAGALRENGLPYDPFRKPS